MTGRLLDLPLVIMIVTVGAAFLGSAGEKQRT